MIWRFTARIKDLTEFTDAPADRIYGCCSDATLSSSDSRSKAAFDREAPSLQAAIQSAMADLTQAGLAVESIEIEAEDLVGLSQ